MRASGYARQEGDYYVEPAWAVNAIADAENLRAGLSIWDPSAGAGNIPATLAARGIPCFASDIVDRGYPGAHVADFFQCGNGAEIIISNPPYGVIEDYVRRALSLADDRVILLARLALLEGRRRQALFRSTPLARVWVSSRRMSMPPGGLTGVKAKGGTIAYAWFVWEHGHSGRAEVDWL
jgi:hypothetical protein